ncbi:MAG: transcriptional regulator [Desulfobacteraceae bacterium]|nr:transcriptional regulator [Desulfobacterales bacterium]MBL6967652.1 transcriptional regulator [Desulfobacteraceae bacterium]MBL7102005.1 transcriptional regulator [Desulfobacteraceae bacterium]MBL7173061.1 transcriptional regulator [Desulfobacteraceae bacterium]
MTIEIKKGNISDFFASAKETAREIDEGKKVTRKNTVWVESKDLMDLLKPERTRLVKYLRGKKRIVFTDLLNDMKRTPVSLNRDLNLLSKYQLIRIYKEPNPGHGIHKVIEPTFQNQKIEIRAEI